MMESARRLRELILGAGGASLSAGASILEPDDPW
jgi:hypothetical protein